MLAQPVEITYNAIVEFEWDPAKAATNLAKHGIDFVEGTLVFEDSLRLERLDSRSRGEHRSQAIGVVAGRTVFGRLYISRADVPHHQRQERKPS
ncbi:MAG TPA: BrnT family toxin [Stellaceae bacterium]|nr:BrnT family toxin [Stellaceae bacterium]